MKLTKSVIGTALLTSLSTFSFAQGLILNDANLRDDLNWLNQQGVIQISTSTWPLSGDEVNRALSNANVQNTNQQRVIDQIQKTLNLENSTLKVDVQLQSKDRQIPQNFAQSRDAQYLGAVEFNTGSDNWDIKLRANAEGKQIIDNGNKVNLEGSYVAGKLWNQWLAFGQIPTYWGPGHDGSLIRGDASRPVTGFTMQRGEQKPFESKWLSWIGPWQYQLFAGQLQDYKAVPDARLLGMRITAQPLPYLELGASRTIQIGGKGQPDTFKAYWNALIGKDNNCDDNNVGCIGEENASNQLGGFEARLNLQPLLNLPISVYGQMIGEDEAGGLPSRYLYMAGTDYSSSFNKMPYQVYAEWTDTRTNGEVRAYSYNHHQYKDGFYQNGYPLAHPLGGDGEMYSVGGNIRIDPMNRVSARILHANVNQSNLPINYAFPKKDKINALDVTWTNTFRPDMAIKVGGWVSDSDIHGNDTGVSVGLEMSLDRLVFNR